MKFKKIILQNIRSYEYQEITFPEGSVLLSGDIGSGKTSVLLGLEFALFGLQPGQKGNSLLKQGEKNARVVLDFEINGKVFIIERTLKKGKTVSQDYCAITIEGNKKELSVTELKSLVLEILNYSKEFAKKQNFLYKFTVYAPQDEMKQIILEDPETRINTLRHVFGIDKYKRVIENISILSSKLREERRIKEGIIEGLEENKTILLSKEDELETKHYNLSSVEKELFVKSELRKKIHEEKNKIFEKIEEKRKFQQEIEKTKIMASNKEEKLGENLKNMRKMELEIEELSSLNFEESKIFELEKEISNKKLERESLHDENLKINSKISSLDLKNRENEEVKARINRIGNCPTCLQTVDYVYKTNISLKIDSDIIENKKQIKELLIEKEKIKNNILEIENQISYLEKKLYELKILKVRFDDYEIKQKRLEEIKQSNFFLEKDISILKEQIEILNKSIFEFNKFDKILEDKQKELEESLRQERMAEIKVAELKKEIEVFSQNIEELKEKIEKSEEVKIKLNYVASLENWLSNNFSAMMYLTERNVMAKLKSEFSKLFARWFSMLVPENFEARLDDQFTPIIEYQDYEIDYAYLSGGEKTAVALAYRLALNQVVNSFLGKIKTRDIIILDEPTDGFSEQQLDKMRDVLNQLDVEQLILVSHEQKIESFVDNIIRFKKENGISKVIEN